MARRRTSTAGTAWLTCTAVVLGVLLAGLTPVAASEGAHRSAPGVTLRTYSLEVAVGKRVALRGRTAAPRGTRVLIQRRTAQQPSFRTVQRTRVLRQGRIFYAERPKDPGRLRLRACVVRGPRTCSKPLRVRVTEPAPAGPQWYYLHDKGPVVPAAGEWCERPETLAGVRYEKSVAFGANCHDNDENYGELALKGDCTTFEAVIGLADASTEDSRYDVRVLVDDHEAFGQSGLARGEASAVSIDLTGAQRLRLEGPFVAGRLGNVVFGDARVLCAF